MRGPDASRAHDPVGWLQLAAAPVFAAMALLNAFTGGPVDMPCAMHPMAPLTGMTLMYVLMAAFHAGPWLRQLEARCKRAPGEPRNRAGIQR